jgi:protein CpxP
MSFSLGQSFAGRTLLAAALAVSCPALYAQNDAAPADAAQAQNGSMRPRGGPNMERQLDQLTRVLSLSPDQQTQVKAVLTEQRAKMEAMRRSANGGDAAAQGGPPNREQMDAMRAETDTRITALLNDEQKTKYAAWQQQRKERMERRGGGGDGPPPAPPSGN